MFKFVVSREFNQYHVNFLFCAFVCSAAAMLTTVWRSTVWHEIVCHELLQALGKRIMPTNKIFNISITHFLMTTNYNPKHSTSCRGHDGHTSSPH